MKFGSKHLYLLSRLRGHSPSFGDGETKVQGEPTSRCWFDNGSLGLLLLVVSVWNERV